MLRWVLFALFFVICAGAGEQKKKKVRPKSFARGWGKDISWVQNYEEGLSKMSEAPDGHPSSSRLPVQSRLGLGFMGNTMGAYLNTCQAGKDLALKKAFVAEESIQKMAKEDFIMLNVVQETTDKNLAPDGYYVPRILFVDPSMTVRTDIAGRYGNRLYTYEPGDMAYLAENMKKAKVLWHEEL